MPHKSKITLVLLNHHQSQSFRRTAHLARCLEHPRVPYLVRRQEDTHQTLITALQGLLRHLRLTAITQLDCPPMYGTPIQLFLKSPPKGDIIIVLRLLLHTRTIGHSLTSRPWLKLNESPFRVAYVRWNRKIATYST